MRKCLILILVLANVGAFAQSQWRCNKDGNPFDGYLKIASVQSYQSEYYVAYTPKTKLSVEVFKNSRGDTIVSISPFNKNYDIAVNGNIYHCLDTDYSHSKHFVKQPLTGVIQGQFKVSPPIKGLINDLKEASGFQIRMGDKLADFKFSLKGSSSAIDCALK